VSGRRAAFLDRDGTLIDEREFLADPDDVAIVPGAPAALRSIRDAGFALVVITNQSGIARGLYSEREFAAVQRRLESMLAAEGVTLDGVFHCPHHPDFSGPCDCRKPATGMFRLAADRLGLDLAASIYVGDRVRDVLPALELGGRGFLVTTGYGSAEATAAPAGVRVVAGLADVALAVGVSG
jgi:D-glycero-D-manno-heptose 1,7-bisphosphate phosphatase